MPKKMEISPGSILEKFSSKKPYYKPVESVGEELTTPQVSDALKRLTGKSGVIPYIKPIKQHIKISGVVVTAKTKSEDWGTVLKAIDAAKNGEILFIDSEDENNAVWGELTTKYAQKKGLEGTVVCGAVRDIGAIRDLNYPVFSRSIVPNAGEPKAEGQINICLIYGEVQIKPGDWILGDECGVIIVPAEIFQEVMEQASQLKKEEAKILSRIEDGWSLSEIFDIK
jgi:3-hexulose-6-phosphate synthase